MPESSSLGTDNNTTWLRNILSELGLKYTISRRSPSALRRLLDEAKAAGQPWLDIGSKGYSFAHVEDLLAKAREVENLHHSAAVPAPSSPPNTRKRYASGLDSRVEEVTPSKRRRKGGPKDGEDDLLVFLAKDRSSSDIDALLTHYQKECLQAQDYGESEIPAFEKLRDDASYGFGLATYKAAIAKSTLILTGQREKHHADRQLEIRDPGVPSTLLVNERVAREAEGNRNLKGASVEDDAQEVRREWKMPTGDYRPEPLKQELVEALKASLRTPPRYLYRASSMEGVKRTNGYDTKTVHVPAAHMNLDEKCHENLYEIPKGLCELIEMLGCRFLWLDRRRDETLSWTSSLLFALVHATGRRAKGQRDVFIHVIDTTKVTTLDGRSVEFHFAPDLLRILKIQCWKGWEDYHLRGLRQPWYTHEWVTHHVVKSPKRHSYEAEVDTLLDCGLFDYARSLKTDEAEHMRSLYHRCCYSRSIEYSIHGPATSMTIEDLDAAKRLATCFLPKDTPSGTQPPMTIFIDFLALKQRFKGEASFTDWIQQHYTNQDLEDAAFANRIRIPNNTPELAQALDLARDACVALGVPPIPGTRVWMADADFDWYCKWLPSTSKEIKIADRGKKNMKRKREITTSGVKNGVAANSLRNDRERVGDNSKQGLEQDAADHDGGLDAVTGAVQNMGTVTE
ncbi:hypothetical protein B0A50_04410 [Salinomyces thailandicus]|uniref:Uncharacterized protein n=1 Tax=Salinomyces thailandicus TaxID=706561 RepID=A0A4U0TYM3_9PEZI|nr:hypothetical protein B0A50_04410 [Salinomyces thailandica]